MTTLFKKHGLAELDTDVVRPGDKRTRGQHRLYQPAAKLSIYNNSFPWNIRDWNHRPTMITDATTIEELRVCPADPSAVILPPCFLTAYMAILTFGKILLSLSPLTGQQNIVLKNPDRYLRVEEEEGDLACHRLANKFVNRKVVNIHVMASI